MKSSILYKVLVVAVSLLSATKVFAQAPVPSDTSKPIAQLLLAVIIALLFVIVLLANVVLGVAKHQLKKEKNSIGSSIAKIVALVVTTAISFNLSAQEAITVVTAPTNYGGLSATSFWGLMSVVLIEVIIIFMLVYNLKLLLKLEEPKVIAVNEAAVEKGPGFWEKWWDKINRFKPVKEEASIDLGHNYDGIRELDNRLPPWWLYGFYVTIIFAGIYLWRYHVAYSAPLSEDELKIAMQKGEEEKLAYLKQAANNIDETNVTLLTDAADIEAGKTIFVKTCATCHKADGGGMVGPNLTDDYWIHGGSVADIFKTIKYGVPDKGMQSWKDSYSPKQMAQIVSFIKSIKGTNPPGAKEPQGELYKENLTTTTDSTNNTAIKDSAVVTK